MTDSNGKPNRHIRFDYSSSESDSTEGEVEEEEITRNPIKLPAQKQASMSASESKTVQVTLIKDKLRNEKTFGFQLKGMPNLKSCHYIDTIEPNSPAHRARLERYDKIIQVNGIDVEQFEINELIKQIQFESSLNEHKLNLVVVRNPDHSAMESADASEQPNLKRCNEDKLSDELGKKRQMDLILEKPSVYETDNFFKSSHIGEIKTASNVQIDLEEFMSVNQLVQGFNQGELLTSKVLVDLRQDKIDQIRFIAPIRTRKPSVPSKLMLNQKAKEIQARLSEQGKYVKWNEVVYELLQLYDCEHIGELNLLQADHLEAINELMRLQKKIDLFIISYESRAPCVCLLDLEQAICNDYNFSMSRGTANPFNASNRPQSNRINRFDELYIGPLIKNQLVREIFKLDATITSIKQMQPIRLIDLLKQLHSFLLKNNLWQTKLKEKVFEDFLLNKYQVKSMSLLGVRINNVGMLVGSMKSVQHNFFKALNELKATISEEFDVTFNKEKTFLFNQLTDRLEKYKDQDSTSHSTNQLIAQTKTKLNYLSSNSTKLVEEFLVLFEHVLDHDDFYYISEFFNILKSNSYMRDCFQLAICLGTCDLDLSVNQIRSNWNASEDSHNPKQAQKYYLILKRLIELIGLNTLSKKQLRHFLNKFIRECNYKLIANCSKQFSDSDEEIEANNSSQLGEEDKTIELFDEELLAKRLEDFIQNRLEANMNIEFEHLIKLEHEVFGNEMKNLPLFSEFLFKYKTLFQQANVSIELLPNPNKSASSYHLTQQSVLLSNLQSNLTEQVKQLMQSRNLSLENEPNLNQINDIICTFYGLCRFDDLGLGSLENFAKSLLNKEKQVENGSQLVDIQYVDAFISHDEIMQQDELSAEFFFEESKKNFFKRLNEDCELLGNIYDYWTSELTSLFGDLKAFLRSSNNAELEKIGFLEVDQNQLLKLSKESEIEDLKSAIECGNSIDSSGHLISLIICKYRGFNKTPTSLLVNEIHSSMAVYLEKCQQNPLKMSHLTQLLNTIKEKGSYIHQQDSSDINYEFFTFIIELICRIPFKLQKNVLFEFVMNPLTKLEQDHELKQKIFEFLVCKEYLHSPNMYKTLSKPFSDKVNLLIRLGQSCSIYEWSLNSFHLILSGINLGREPEFKTDQNDLKVRNKTENKNCIVQEELMETNQTEATRQETAESSQIKASECQLSEQSELIEYEHVKSIRERYGIGIELDEQSKSVTESLKGVIGRSLESLSNELYNKDMHFVLELIQNADDNRYEAEQNVEPTLIFLVDADKITLLNNETGFSSRNIDAICDVKASTKGKHQHGYIGRKGIGFKSVFTVTDCPEIHSNNYHIRFDLNNGHIGYILPNWLSDSERRIDEVKQFVYKKIQTGNMVNIDRIGRLNTCIHLPLKSESEMQRHKSSLLTNNFNDIKPFLLLFLNRLRNLAILRGNERADGDLVYHREDLNENLVEIRSNLAQTHRWLVVRETLHVPDNLKPSNQVESTDLCLAFPLDNLNQARTGTTFYEPLPKMDVFAYLPLRSFGFTFIVQADFVVPASRQDINQDSDWNQWLAKHIPKVFLKSLDHFKQINESNQVEAIKSFLRFIPLEEDIFGFFQHVPREILKSLRNESVLPAVDVDGSVTWKKPFECVMIKDEDHIRQVLTSDLLKKYLGKYYLHSALLNQNEINSKMLFNLGVRSLNLADLFEILKTIFSCSQFDDIKTTANWLVVLQHCMNNYSLKQEESFLSQLKQLRFVPIVKGEHREMVSMDKETVFFPSRLSSSKQAPKSKKDVRMTSLIEPDLCLLDTDSLLCLDEFKNAQIINVMKNLGVKQIEPKEIIECHIIKNFRSISLSEESKLISYLIFVFHYASSFLTLHLGAQLKESLLIKTNHGFKSIQSENVYLGPEYGNKYDLKAMLPSYNWCLVDSVYLSKSAELLNEKKAPSKQEHMIMWRKFLIKLGLNDLFMPCLKTQAYSADELKNSTYPCELQPIGKDEFYQVNDYECPIFQFYMNAISQTEFVISKEMCQELKSLYQIVEENWNECLSRFKNVHVNVLKSDKATLSKANQIKENLCESTYFRSLRTSKWICAECTEYLEDGSKYLTVSTQVKVKQPNEVFVKEQVFLRIYGLNVPYAIQGPVKSSSLSKELMFKQEFFLDEFLRKFADWTQQPRFYASVSQMRNIYLLLSSHLSSSPEPHFELSQLLESNVPFIFVPDVYEESERLLEKVLPGVFYSFDQVYLSDPTRLFTKYHSTFANVPVVLENVYLQFNKGEQLKQFFQSELNIKPTPDIKYYLALLNHIALLSSTGKSAFSQSEQLADVHTIFEFLVEQTCNGADESMQICLYEALKSKPIVPCLNNKWMSADDNPVLVDCDFELAEKFQDKLNLIITKYDDTSSTDCLFENLTRIGNLGDKIVWFYSHILRVKKFSQVVVLDLENITESLREAPLVKNTCRRLLPFIQCFLYSRAEFRPVHDSIDGERLNQLKFYSVRDLQNTYRCLHDSNIHVIISNKSCFDTSATSVYWKYFVRADLLESEKDVIRGFVKIFVKREFVSEQMEKEFLSYCLFMNQLVNYRLNEEDRREIERDYKISLSLPDELFKWHIPEAVFSRLMGNEMEEGEIYQEQDESRLSRPRLENNREKDFNSQNKRLKLIEYEKLSNSQISDPNVKFDAKSCLLHQPTNYSQIRAEPKMASFDEFNKNLNDLAAKMTRNFDIQSINQNEITLNATSAATNSFANEWNKQTMNNFEQILASSTPNDNDFKWKIGKWGEMWVNEMLKKKYESELEQKRIRIEWMNELEESGLPYDFRITHLSNSDNVQANHVEFIEVKSTSKSDQDIFQISYQELVFAHQFNTNYEILRLYNAGSTNPNHVSYKVLKNVPSLLNAHGINLFMMI